MEFEIGRKVVQDEEKIFAVLLIGILGISLVACNKGNTADASVVESEKEMSEIVQETQKEET